ncbi:alpha-L-rhamnosidase [Brachybacterium sp.]|uniref:alpha-L-rhamnosidase n=1 Tax=Brachybacterium sp. TaxID=1891286 RepID=UPI002ED33A0A
MTRSPAGSAAHPATPSAQPSAPPGHTACAEELADAAAITAQDRSLRALVLVREATPEAGRIARAELIATAHGVYEARIGGAPVGDAVLAPGWTTYETQLQVQRYEVTEQVRTAAATGSLPLEIHLGDGWWRGSLGFAGGVDYGEDISALAALEITFEDGRTQRIVTDETWTARPGVVLEANIYHGQHEDRRLGPGEEQPVRVVDLDRATLVEQSSPMIRRQETRRPTRIWTSPSGKTLLDFGQNLVGWLRFTVTGPAGTTITLRHAEVLEHEELGTRPLRSAKATDSLILAGDPDGETFEPTSTFHGFRYAEVTGWPGELTVADIEAVVVHSDLRRNGWFESSHEGVNQLISNSIWSQRGNFLAVPTDCPQRDERLGWTGDIAAYAATAAYQFDVDDFLHTWLLDVAAEAALNPAGHVPFVVPDLLKLGDGQESRAASPEGWGTPTAIWGDAAVWVPEALWNAYGDLDRLRLHYPGMVLHLESVERALSPSGLWDQGFQFGDWLDPDAPPEAAADAKADKAVVATACLVRSARFTAETARLIGEEEGARRWQDLADRTLTAFTEAYVHEDGTITSDCTTVYSLAIAFDLLEPALRDKAAQRLAELVREADYRVSTGFAGTPFITWALSETGHVEDAYRLLLEEGCPSWLYPVSRGATTIWERWDSMLPDGAINPGEMTSFNHYALGAVADWVYQVVLGIRAAEPGYRRILLQPTPGPGIDWAKGAYDSTVGRIEVSWESTADGLRGEATIPEGAEADLVLPDGTARVLSPGRHVFP